MTRILRIAIPSALFGAWLYAVVLLHELDKLNTGQQTRTRLASNLLHEIEDGRVTFYIPDSATPWRPT